LLKKLHCCVTREFPTKERSCNIGKIGPLRGACSVGLATTAVETGFFNSPTTTIFDGAGPTASAKTVKAREGPRGGKYLNPKLETQDKPGGQK
jgi:hypothetical protein